MSFPAGILGQSQLLHLKLVLATLKHTFCLTRRCKCRAPDFPEGYQGTGGRGWSQKAEQGSTAFHEGLAPFAGFVAPNLVKQILSFLRFYGQRKRCLEVKVLTRSCTARKRRSWEMVPISSPWLARVAILRANWAQRDTGVSFTVIRN